MPNDKPLILIIDPAAQPADEASEALKGAGYAIHICPDGAEGLKAYQEKQPVAVVAEAHLEELGGLQLCAELHSADARLPVVVISASSDSRAAIAAIKAGAYDYLPKPLDSDELVSVIDEATAAARRASTPVEIAPVYEEQDTLIGKSRAMTRLYAELARISPTPVPVLVRGETGTGKELIARALYQHGHRATRPFIAVNCAAIPANLLESELFGHEPGAFTGATGMRIGRFEQAHNGTLFLDEIGDLDLPLQSKLLRVLQERQIQRVGSSEDIPVDARIITATHRDLEAMVAAGEFRADLFYRLNVASLEVPPLHKREGDIPLLVEHFLARYGEEIGINEPSITKGAIHFLADQTWPGNVRQLQNTIRKALLGCRGYAIDAESLIRILADSESAESETGDADLHTLARKTLQRAIDGEIEAAHPALIAEAERTLLEVTIRAARGNKSQAARWLGISRLTLREKLKSYGLHPKG